MRPREPRHVQPAKTNEPVEEIHTHYKLLEAFDWHERARTMVRERLGWQLLREVP